MQNIEKPEAFWNNVTKPKLNFLATTIEGIFWRKKGDAFVTKNTFPTVKHEVGSIMLWGCVADEGKGNIVRVEGRMDSTEYQEILEANVQRLVQTLKLK